MLKAVQQVVKEREWEKHHTPKNTAMSLVREASEAMEHMIWETDEEILSNQEKKQEIAYEMGDVLHCLLLLADAMDVDLADSFWKKLEKVKKRYPPVKK